MALIELLRNVSIFRDLDTGELARVAEVQTGEIPTLRRDPVTGAYRPG